MRRDNAYGVGIARERCRERAAGAFMCRRGAGGERRATRVSKTQRGARDVVFDVVAEHRTLLYGFDYNRCGGFYPVPDGRCRCPETKPLHVRTKRCQGPWQLRLGHDRTRRSSWQLFKGGDAVHSDAFGARDNHRYPRPVVPPLKFSPGCAPGR